MKTLRPFGPKRRIRIKMENFQACFLLCFSVRIQDFLGSQFVDQRNIIMSPNSITISLIDFSTSKVICRLFYQTYVFTARGIVGQVVQLSVPMYRNRLACVEILGGFITVSASNNVTP